MTGGPIATPDSRILLVDANVGHGAQLAAQLHRAGFNTDCATSWDAARAALRTKYLQSCVVFMDLNQSRELLQLDELRRAALRVWMIVISDLELGGALTLAHLRGVDAVLSASFSMQDLTSRLAAFSFRERPTF